MVEVKVVVAVVLSTFFILSEAAVTVEVISGLSTDNTIECGKQDKIRCVVSPFPGTGGYMAWNTNSKPLTQCFDGSDNDCNSLSVDHYQFTSKPADETFNLTFNTVKLSDGSVEFICTDTITTDSVTPNVTVLPVISSTELVNTSANVIKVTTGCVYPPDDVTFKWMFYAENEDAANAKDYGGSHSVMTEDSSTCTVGDCGGSDVKLRSSTLELENTEKGGSYNFKVVITHAALSETVTKTIGPFELGEPPANVTIPTTTSPNTTTTPPSGTTQHPKTPSITVIIVLCVALVLLFAILIIICLYLRYKRNQSKQKENPQSYTQDHSSKENKRQFSDIGSSDMKEHQRVTNPGTNRSNAYQGDITQTEQL